MPDPLHLHLYLHLPRPARALARWWRIRRYRGPVPVGLLRPYLGRRVRVDYDPRRGRGWHGEGLLLAAERSELSSVYQALTIRPADGIPVTLHLPLSATVEVLR